MSTPLENKDRTTPVIIPFSVIENFFRYVHLHEAKEILTEVKEQLLHKNYPHSSGTVPYDNTIYFFEKLEELLNAVHLLHKRHS
jgi:hypothetical protein